MCRAFMGAASLFLAPSCQFFGAFFIGAGVLSFGNGFLIGAVGFLILPWIVSAFVVALARSNLPVGVLIYLGTLVLQATVMIRVIPPGATSQTMGLAYKLRHEFSAGQLRSCADQIRQKHHQGTLSLSTPSNDRYNLIGNTQTVSDTELPADLRGRFGRVLISDPDSVDEKIWFMLDPRTGIICDHRKYVRGFSECSMAEGVHAYRYDRRT